MRVCQTATTNLNHLCLLVNLAFIYNTFSFLFILLSSLSLYWPVVYLNVPLIVLAINALHCCNKKKRLNMWSVILRLYLVFHILYKVFCIYIVYIIQLETVQCLSYRVRRLKANLLQFTFCVMNIQCLTIKLNSLSSENTALLNISSFNNHKETNVFSFLPLIMCRNLRLLSMSELKVLQ